MQPRAETKGAATGPQFRCGSAGTGIHAPPIVSCVDAALASAGHGHRTRSDIRGIADDAVVVDLRRVANIEAVGDRDRATAARTAAGRVATERISQDGNCERHTCGKATLCRNVECATGGARSRDAVIRERRIRDRDRAAPGAGEILQKIADGAADSAWKGGGIIVEYAAGDRERPATVVTHRAA